MYYEISINDRVCSEYEWRDGMAGSDMHCGCWMEFFFHYNLTEGEMG
jgi:hypothetical protein